MRRASIVLALIVAGASRSAGSQLPFAVRIVGWERDAFEHQRRFYSSAANEYEVLFCVEAWRTVPSEKGVEQIIITRVRRKRNGAPHRVADVGALCVRDGGAPLPMIHTHSQRELSVLTERSRDRGRPGRRVRGIQCGDQHFVWEYAWRVIAISTLIEPRRADDGTRPPAQTRSSP